VTESWHLEQEAQMGQVLPAAEFPHDARLHLPRLHNGKYTFMIYGVC